MNWGNNGGTEIVEDCGTEDGNSRHVSSEHDSLRNKSAPRARADKELNEDCEAGIISGTDTEQYTRAESEIHEDCGTDISSRTDSGSGGNNEHCGPESEQNDDCGAVMRKNTENNEQCGAELEPNERAEREQNVNCGTDTASGNNTGYGTCDSCGCEVTGNRMGIVEEMGTVYEQKDI